MLVPAILVIAAMFLFVAVIAERRCLYCCSPDHLVQRLNPAGNRPSLRKFNSLF
jgi:hypothetical protein